MQQREEEGVGESESALRLILKCPRGRISKELLKINVTENQSEIQTSHQSLADLTILRDTKIIRLLATFDNDDECVA
jgi:hypothetical protein